MRRPNENDPEELFRLWQHEGLTPLTTVLGYTDLLLQGKAGELTEMQRQFVETIRSSTAKGILAWRNPGHYLALRSAGANGSWKGDAVHLRHLAEILFANSNRATGVSTIDLRLSESLPPVKADAQWLGVALLNMLEASVGLAYIANFAPSIGAEQVNPLAVRVEIKSGLSVSPEQQSIADCSYPGGSLMVAALIIKQHDSKLHMEPCWQEDSLYSQGVKFWFDLPVWQS